MPMTIASASGRNRNIISPANEWGANYCMPNRKPTRDSATVEQLIRYGAAELDRAGVCFGHGSDNAVDEAAELVFFAAGLRHEDAERVYGHTLTASQRAAALELLDRRVRERVPAAYLTRRMWFAGHEFYVDERVLVPRSPIAELIEARFQPWIDPSRIERVLDIGTGSGCIAIATALAFPEARVDAADISSDALAVTAINIEKHDVRERVRAVRSDVFDALAHERYDVIVSNPPYVGEIEMSELPEEYRHEPSVGLRAGRDGLDVVRRIIAGAPAHLRPQGVLIAEVGNSEQALVEAYPRAPFTWLEFERGGGGVCLLTAEQLREMAALRS
jgi:ribosomal protein L3 glutamine methyltransferase